MSDLEISNLYQTTDQDHIDEFVDKMNSNMKVKTDYSKDDYTYDWIEIFETTIPYLDKILRNPNKFIKNDEELLKIEQSKKVTVESIKHLSKHTNLIQDVDKETGDVRPSKLLNVLKEETIATYENSFIYTLINYMIEFIKLKTNRTNKDPRLKDKKKVEYNSTTLIGEEKVNVSIQLNTDLDTSLLDPEKEEKIKNIADKVKALMGTETYKRLEKDRVPMVQNPIKRTNVILKNVNFQYAMKLWDYIHKHLGDKENKINEQKNYDENGHIKKLIDETFLLEYLTVNSIGKDNKVTQEMKEKTISSMLDKIIDMNPELTKKELQKKIGDRFEVVKKQKAVTKEELEKIFRKYINKYFKKISKKT